MDRVIECYGSLLGRAMRIVDQVHDAEDLVQSAIVRSYERLRGISDPVGYVMVSIRNVHRDALRRKKCRPAVGSLEHEPLSPEEPEPPALLEEQKAALQKALGKLRKSDRVLLEVYYGPNQQPTLAQIAALYGASRDMIRSRLYRARLALRQEIELILKKEGRRVASKGRA